MEKHVTSLGISKKLKDLGVKQESILCWVESLVGTAVCLRADMPPPREYLAAFLASELGELLPGFVHERFELVIRQGPVVGNWTVGYLDEEGYLVKDLRFFSTSMPDAMGKMLIYLLENKLINLGGVA